MMDNDTAKSFWHNYRTFRGHMAGKSMEEVRRSKAIVRGGPIAALLSAVVEALPAID